MKEVFRVFVRLLLFLLVSMQIAMSFSALCLFMNSGFFSPTSSDTVNLIIRIFILIEYFAASFVIWCWIGYIILAPLGIGKNKKEM